MVVAVRGGGAPEIARGAALFPGPDSNALGRRAGFVNAQPAA